MPDNELTFCSMSETGTAHDVGQHRAETDGINVMDGESVLENVRPGWSVWAWQIVLAVLILFGGLGGDAAAAGLFGGGAIFAYVVISRMQSRYIVTDERVKSKVGILSKKQREYRIADLQSISSSQGIIERLLGHGSITLRAAANDEITWKGVPDYSDVTNTIRQEQRKYD